MLLDSGYFFNPIKRDIAMIQGDTCSFAFELQGLQGQRPDSIILSCKEKVEDEEALFEVSDIDTIDERSYDSSTDTLTYSVRIPPYLTHNIPLGRYFYDLQIALNSDVFTLMTGRLILEAQITLNTVPSPATEVADDILYPNEDIVIGRVKGYTESYVNEIALKINSILSSESGEYKIAQMSLALQGVRDYLTAINSSINSVLENDTEYSIDQMAAAILSFESKFNSVIDNSIVNLKTNVEDIPAYKFRNAKNLETVYLTNCKSIGDSAFSMDATLNPSLERITIDCDNLGDEVFSIGDNAFEFISLAVATLKDFIVNGVRYIGMVEGSLESETNPIVEVFDLIYYGDDTVREVTAERGDLAVNSETGEPYIYSGSYWRLYIPTYSATLENSSFSNSRVRNLGFKFNGSISKNCLRDSSILFVVLDKNFGTVVNNSFYKASELRGVFQEVGDGEFSNNLNLEEVGVSSVTGSFADTPNLKYISIPKAKTVKSYAFINSGLKTISLPALEVLGHTSKGAFEGCTNLETVTLGNGTKAFTFGGTTSTNHFYGCTSLYSLTIDSTAYINLTGSTQTMAKILYNTPILNFLGTTTTAITEDSTTTSIVINGSTVTATNGKIATYDGKDFILVNGAWQEWGSNGSKHPVIRVPSSQITSYQNHSKWGVLSSEIWQAI